MGLVGFHAEGSGGGKGRGETEEGSLSHFFGLSLSFLLPRRPMFEGMCYGFSVRVGYSVFFLCGPKVGQIGIGFDEVA